MKDIEIIGRKILKKIKEFKRIFVFRHESPDYDALGTQFGLYTFLKENFKDKEIHATGFANVPLAPLLYPENEVLNTFEEDGIKVQVTKALGEKCERCWKYRVLDKNSKHPTICEDCQKAIEE